MLEICYQRFCISSYIHMILQHVRNTSPHKICTSDCKSTYHSLKFCVHLSLEVQEEVYQIKNGNFRLVRSRYWLHPENIKQSTKKKIADTQDAKVKANRQVTSESSPSNWWSIHHVTRCHRWKHSIGSDHKGMSFPLTPDTPKKFYSELVLIFMVSCFLSASFYASREQSKAESFGVGGSQAGLLWYARLQQRVLPQLLLQMTVISHDYWFRW